MKRTIVAIILGLAVIIVGWFLAVLLNSYAIRISFPQEIESNGLLIEGVIRSLPWLSSLLAGFVTGYVLKNKGWFYGGLVGGIVVVGITFALIIAYLRPQGILSPEYSDEYTKEILYNNIQKSIVQGLFMVIITGIGGWLGEMVGKGKPKQLI